MQNWIKTASIYCVCISLKYNDLFLRSSSWEPCSTILPLSITVILFVIWAIERRWAIKIIVFEDNAMRFLIIFSSVKISSPLVDSLISSAVVPSVVVSVNFRSVANEILKP